MISISTGRRGHITATERFKSPPFLRYTIEFEDGETDEDLIIGEDVKLDLGARP